MPCDRVLTTGLPGKFLHPFYNVVSRVSWSTSDKELSFRLDLEAELEPELLQRSNQGPSVKRMRKSISLRVRRTSEEC